MLTDPPFLPTAGIIIMIMIVGVQITIIIANMIKNYNCKMQYNLLNLDLVQYMLTGWPEHVDRNQRNK